MKPSRSRALCPLFILFALALAQAQEGPLDSLLDGYEAERSFSGSILVTRGGQPLFSRSCGFRNIELTVNNDAGSIYYIGSVSKVFVAALVLRAAEEGRLALDDPVSRFVPELPAARSIRISNLLNHSSGLVEYYGLWATRGRFDLGLEDFLGFLAGRDPEFAAGTRCSYSNSNYELAALILERVYGKPYREILQTGIIEPLGLAETGFGLFSDGDGRLARSQMEYSLVREIAPWRDACIPSGSLYSTVGDLDRFFSALAAGRIISKDSFSLMHASTIADGDMQAGYGFWTLADGSYFKTGSIGGYKSLLYRDPGRDLDIYILSSAWIPLSGASFLHALVPAIIAQADATATR